MSLASSVASSCKKLAGKVAIITGGASGIGAATAHLFSEHGAKVVIADVQDNLGQKVVAKDAENLSYVHCDVSKEEDITNLVDSTVAKYGQLDIMYNNAGVLDNNTSILTTPTSVLERLLSINVVGYFLGAKHAARVMVPRQKGCILFTGSVGTSIVGIGTHCYNITKYAGLGLAKVLAIELGQHGIRVNTISPYGVATGMAKTETAEATNAYEQLVSEKGNLKGKVLTSEDVAKSALFLASDEDSGYVNGQNIVVDGGFSIVNPSFLNDLDKILKT